jgi:DHA2 family multidrug resistance protein-like MFS transporter
LLPEYRDPDAGRLDLWSAAQSLAAVLAVIYGLKRIAEGGVGWLAAACIVAGLAIGAAFLKRQRTLANPLIDLALFRVPAFSAALAINTFCFFGAFGAFLFIAQYLQLVIGLSPLEAGLWSVPSAVGFVVGSMLAPVIVRRIRAGLAVTGGLALAFAGFVVLTQVGGPSGLATLVTGSVIFSLGLAPVVTLGTDLIVGSAPPERAGAAAAISETSSEFGGALGIAVLGSGGGGRVAGRQRRGAVRHLARCVCAGLSGDGRHQCGAGAGHGHPGCLHAAAGACRLRALTEPGCPCVVRSALSGKPTDP